MLPHSGADVPGQQSQENIDNTSQNANTLCEISRYWLTVIRMCWTRFDALTFNKTDARAAFYLQPSSRSRQKFVPKCSARCVVYAATNDTAYRHCIAAHSIYAYTYRFRTTDRRCRYVPRQTQCSLECFSLLSHHFRVDHTHSNTTELCMLRQQRELRSEYHFSELLIVLFTVPSGIDFAQSLGHHEPPDYVFLHLSSPRKTPFVYTHGQAQYYRRSYLLNAENT
ncbi:hypothetical protein IW262DRAFT_723742 [Armillaria fumosa]|nr:hypothetical protein IW262DRAFT_723742 [Armillaria fumosa]